MRASSSRIWRTSAASFHRECVAAQRWPPVAAAALAAFLVGALGAAVTDLSPWYEALAKPSWQPPDWLFGPAWTLIFSLAAMSGVVGWTRAPNARCRGGCSVFLRSTVV
jgi:tryptophan-rich sensory protein